MNAGSDVIGRAVVVDDVRSFVDVFAEKRF